MHPANFPKSTGALWDGIKRFQEVESVSNSPTANMRLGSGEL
jgi:hypothetical protein